MDLFKFINQSNEKQNIYGVVIGIVTNNKDPEGLGRVKVRYPWSCLLYTSPSPRDRG